MQSLVYRHQILVTAEKTHKDMIVIIQKCFQRFGTIVDILPKNRNAKGPSAIENETEFRIIFQEYNIF